MSCMAAFTGKNLTVGYTLPRQWTRKALIENKKIKRYMASADGELDRYRN